MTFFVSFLGILVGGGIAWMLVPAFYSGSQKWRTSPIKFFISRLSVTVVFGIFSGIFAAAMVTPKPADGPSPKPDSKSDGSVTPPPTISSNAAVTNQNSTPETTSQSSAVAPPQNPSVAALPQISSDIPGTARSNQDLLEPQATKVESTNLAIERKPEPQLDLQEFGCEQPRANYQKVVCSDPPLRMLEARLVNAAKEQVHSTASAESSAAIGRKFSQFRSVLNDCKYKNCIEGAYAEFEKGWNK